MSNDLTDRLPDEPRGTAPILEQIVAELRGLREDVATLRGETHATRVAVENLAAHVDRLTAETRAGIRREILADAELVNSRLERLEADVRALKGGPAS